MNDMAIRDCNFLCIIHNEYLFFVVPVVFLYLAAFSPSSALKHHYEHQYWPPTY